MLLWVVALDIAKKKKHTKKQKLPYTVPRRREGAEYKIVNENMHSSSSLLIIRASISVKKTFSINSLKYNWSPALKLHLTDWLWSFSAGSRVHIHHSSLLRILDFHNELSKTMSSLSSCFTEVKACGEKNKKRHSSYEGGVSWCEWRSFTSDVSAADESTLQTNRRRMELRLWDQFSNGEAHRLFLSHSTVLRLWRI